MRQQAVTYKYHYSQYKKTSLLITLLCMASIAKLNALIKLKDAHLAKNLSQLVRQNPITTSILAGSVALAALYRLRHADKSLPTIEQLNVVTFTPIGKASTRQAPDTSSDVVKFLKQKVLNKTIVVNGNQYRVERGIPDSINQTKGPVSIYSGGYSNEGKPYAYCGYTAIKAGLVPGACVVFDFAKDTRRGFNFCQEQDQHSVDLVCKELISKKSDVRIILHGACKGAANNLRYLGEQSEKRQDQVLSHIKAVIAESPPISAAHALKNTPGSSITSILMRLCMPNYNPNGKTIMQTRAFPRIPVLVAALPKDTISEPQDVIEMVSYLNQTSGSRSVELFISKEEEIIHGQIGKARDYQEKVASFLTNLIAK